MAGIATLGIGANLDLNNQMDQIEAVERRRLEPLTTQKASYDAQISAFGKMQSSLEKLKKAAEILKNMVISVPPKSMANIRVLM